MQNEWDEYPVFEDPGRVEDQWAEFPQADTQQAPPPPEPPKETFKSRSEEIFKRIRGVSVADALKGIGENILAGVTGGASTMFGGYAGVTAGSLQHQANQIDPEFYEKSGRAQEDFLEGRPDLAMMDRGIPPGDTARRTVEYAQETGTYEPRTEAGKGLEELLSIPFEEWEKFAYDFSFEAGEPHMVTGATGAYSALMLLPAMVGMRVIKHRRGAGAPRGGHVKPSQTLRQEAAELYRRADETQAAVTAKSYDGVLDAIVKKLTDEGYDPGLHPKTAAALNNLQGKAGNNQTLKGVEINRRIINNARGSLEASDARMAGQVLDVYDDWMNSLRSSDMLLGTPEAASVYRSAREVWSRKMKADELEWAIERANQRANANYAGAGFETALRQEFKSILLNKRRRRMFSPEEIKAIEAVSQGDISTNLLRLVGKLAPRGVISAAPGAAVLAANPVAGAAVWAVGETAKQSAQMLTKKRAYDALEGVARSPETR